MKNSKSTLSFLFKICFASGLIGYLIYRGDLNFEQIVNAPNPGYLVIAGVLIALNLYSNNFRWYLLLKGQGFSTSNVETFKLTLMGTFFNFCLPSSVGGDVIKGYYLAADNKGQRVLAATSVLVDRIIGVVGMLGIACWSLIANWDVTMNNSTMMALLYVVVPLFFGLIMFFLVASLQSVEGSKALNRVLSWLPPIFKDIYSAIHSFSRKKASLVAAFFVTLVSQGLIICFMMVFAQAIGISGIPLGAYMFAIPIGFIIMSIPISPGGLGVGQVAFLTLFQMYLGYETQLGPLGISGLQLGQLLLGFIGAGIYMTRKKQIPQEVVA